MTARNTLLLSCGCLVFDALEQKGSITTLEIDCPLHGEVDPVAAVWPPACFEYESWLTPA